MTQEYKKPLPLMDGTTKEFYELCKRHELSFQRCKQCGICTHFCPEDALAELDDGTPVLEYPEKCTSCGLCEDMCPDWAVCLTVPDQGESATEAS